MDEINEHDRGTTVRRIRNSLTPPNRPLVDDGSTPPMDNGGAAYWSCVVLGISCLLPWNLFITAHGYFSYKFRPLNDSHSGNTSLTKETNLAASFEVYFTLTGSAATVLAAVINIALTSHLSLPRRMIGGHAVVILSLIISLAFSFVNTDRWQTGFLGLNLILIIMGQVGCTFIGGSVLGLAAQLPEARFTSAVISAQAFCGIFTSVINILSIAVGSADTPSLVGAVYFAIALLFTVFSLGVYFAMMKNSYAQYYIKKAAFISVNEDTEPLMVDSQADSLDDSIGDNVTVVGRRGLWAVVKKTIYHGLMLMMTLMATLICFPSLTSLVKSTAIADSLWHAYFIPVTCFLLFNTMDFAGRCLGNCFFWPKSGSLWIAFFVLLRFGFVFLFLFCNLPPYGIGENFKVFSDDFYFVFFVLALGLTNGFFANLNAVYVPTSVEASDRESAGAATAFYFAIGVLLGSIASLFVVRSVV